MTTSEPEQSSTASDVAVELPEQQPEPESRQQRRDEHVRERLREVEAERDRLAERLDQRDRSTVQAAAVAALGERGAALLSYEISDLRDEDGNLDAERVERVIEPLRAALAEAKPVQHHGDMGPRKTPDRSKGSTWPELLARRR